MTTTIGGNAESVLTGQMNGLPLGSSALETVGASYSELRSCSDTSFQRSAHQPLIPILTLLHSGQTDGHGQAASSENTLKSTKVAAAMPNSYDALHPDESALQALHQQIQAGRSIPLQHSRAPSSAPVPNFLSVDNAPLSSQTQPTAGFEGFRHQLALEIAMAEKMVTSRRDAVLVDERQQQNAELAAFQEQYSLMNQLGGYERISQENRAQQEALQYHSHNLLGGQNLLESSSIYQRHIPSNDQATSLLEEQQIDTALKELEQTVLKQKQAIPQQRQWDYSLHGVSQLPRFGGSTQQNDTRLLSMPGATRRENESLNQGNFLRELGLPSHEALLGLRQEALTHTGDLSSLSHQEFLNLYAGQGVNKAESKDNSSLISLSSGPRSSLSRDAQLAQMNRIWNQQRMALAKVADEVMNESRETDERQSLSDDSHASEERGTRQTSLDTLARTAEMVSFKLDRTRQTSLDTLARTAEMVSFKLQKSNSSLSDENKTIRHSSNLSSKKKEKKISSIWQKMKEASQHAPNLKLGRATQSLVDSAPIKRKRKPGSGDVATGNAKKGPKNESKNDTVPKPERANKSIEPPDNAINEHKPPKKCKLNISKSHSEDAITAPAKFTARSGSHETPSTLSHELLSSAKNIPNGGISPAVLENIYVEPPLAEVSYRGHGLPEVDEGQFDDPEDDIFI